MSERIRTAVVLAGGLGTRLRPYTVALPKPLMPLGNYPILEIILRQLAHNGFAEVVLAVNHQADLIKAYFGDGSKLGIRLRYSLETTPLGTMGPLRMIDGLPDNFLVMNGDILSDLHYGEFLDRHVLSAALFTVAAASRRVLIDYGVLEIDSASRLTGFHEKPSFVHHVSMGVYAVNRRITRLIPPDQRYGVDDLLLELMTRGEVVQVVPQSGYWLDIGRPEDYMKASEEFEDQQRRFIPEYPCAAK